MDAEPWLRIKTENGRIVKTKLIGAYNFSNIAAALCIGKFFEVNSDAAHDAVSSYVPSNNRSQIISKGTNTIILDAYNANPDSMTAALENMINMKAAKKIVILGDMLELGNQTQPEHRNIGKLTDREGFDEVILCGKHMEYAKQENKNSVYFKTRSELEKYIVNRSFDHSLILIKASRGMQLEEIIDKIKTK